MLLAADNNNNTTHNMYQILKNGKLLINAQDMETAIVYVRSLESNLDRNVEHSPYTIRKVDHTGALDMS